MTNSPRSVTSTLACLLSLLLLADAGAFHRDLSAVTAITLSGSTDLPRIPPQGHKVMVLERDAVGGGREVVSLLPFTTFAATTQVSPSGTEPAVSFNGRVFAWEADDDPLGLGLPGTQIVLRNNSTLMAGPTDPSGTSAKPSIDRRGRNLVFESDGDLTGTGGPAVTRVYLYDFFTAVTSLVSTGEGDSGNAMISSKGRSLAFTSTSDPTTGADTGVSQIWVGDLAQATVHQVTNGVGPSTEPLVSDEGRLVAFSSTADLAGDGHDTGTKQIFVYDDRTGTYARLTNEPGGCARPAVSRVRSDWRVAFVCGGQAYFHMLREDRRYHVPTPGGVTQSIIPDMGVYFVTLSTTANLYDGTTHDGYRLYMRNLFALPAIEVPGSAALWFPFRGIPGF